MYVEYKLVRLINFKRVKHQFLVRGLSSSANPLYEWNSRITRCFKQGNVGDARHVFDEMPHKNVVTWNCMISGYVRNGMIGEARQVFNTMPWKNVVSYTAMLSGYAKMGNLEEATKLFDEVGDKNVVCWNSMISGYLSNGRIEEGRALFDVMPAKNSVSWATMIEGYFKYGDVNEAKGLFLEAPEKNLLVYNAMLAGYAERGCVEDSSELFSTMVEKDVASWTNMIRSLMRAGQVERGRQLFDEMPEKDVVAWTAMIKGYLDANQIDEAEKLFNEMAYWDIVAWNLMIGGYVQTNRLQDALDLFVKMPRKGIVSWNLILEGYVKQSDIVSAHKFFMDMPNRDKTSWNIIISGYESKEALLLCVQMLQEGFKPDQGTFTVVLSICGALALEVWGRLLHACVIRTGLEIDTMVVSSLISMYSRCGLIEDATSVFDRAKVHDAVVWNAMVVSQAYHGSAAEAFNLLSLMIKAGNEPDSVTFLGLLIACAHCGLVGQGWKYFNLMETWKLIPKPEHYAVMVDLLSRSGLVVEAYELVKQLPLNLPVYAWETLLSSCRVHENFELGDIVARKLSSFERQNVGMHVLLSNTYAARGMWKNAAHVREVLEDQKLKKELACSWIEINGCISQFVYNDKSHPESMEIYHKLENLSEVIQEFPVLIH